jgi:hypothetical protein
VRSARSDALLAALVVASRPVDPEVRDDLIGRTIDAIAAENVGNAGGLDEWASRCALHAASVIVARRYDEARLLAAAARLLAA